jgi:beta-1,4-N-acetylglucosaminyltransferase
MATACLTFNNIALFWLKDIPIVYLNTNYARRYFDMAEQMSEKVCFVTTGATAPFTALIESVLSPSSQDALLDYGFTHLLVQYGDAKDVFDFHATAARNRPSSPWAKRTLVIEGTSFKKNGLWEQFRQVQQSEGLVISHAGI